MLTASEVVFKDFVCLLGTVILWNNSFVLKGKDHFHNMRDFQSKPICSKFNYTFVVLESFRKVDAQKLLVYRGSGKS